MWRLCHFLVLFFGLSMTVGSSVRPQNAQVLLFDETFVPHMLSNPPAREAATMTQDCTATGNTANSTQTLSVHPLIFQWEFLNHSTSSLCVWCVHAVCFVVSDFFVTPWTVAHQAPVSMGFPRQEHWSGLPCPPPSDLPNPGIKPRYSNLQVDSLPSEPPGNPQAACRSTNFKHFLLARSVLCFQTFTDLNLYLKSYV